MNSTCSKICIVLLIILVVCLFGFGYKFKCHNEAMRFYKQGMTFYTQKKYSDAYYNFKQIKPISELYELSLVKQYQCADRLSDKKIAFIKISRLAKITKDKNIRPWALYNKAVLGLELNSLDENQAYKIFKEVNETFKENDYAIASAYRMAKIAEGKNNSYAYKNYIAYLKDSPNGKFSLNALEGISQIETQRTHEEYEIIGKAYLSNQHYSQALDAFKHANFSNNWYNISKCYKGLKDRTSERDTIVKGFNLNESNVEEKEISVSIDRLIAISGLGKAQTLQRLYEKYQDSYVFPTIIYKLAENSRSQQAIKLYELITDEYQTSIWASNSLWEVFWYNYKLSRFKTCEEYAKAHMAMYPQTPDAPRIEYWYAKMLLKEKKNQHAREIFHEIINNYPLSYYAFLSAKQLKLSKAKKMTIKKPIVSCDINSINKSLFQNKALLILAQENDFETIDELKINDELIKSWIANKKGNYPKSITLARDEINKKMKIPQSDEEAEEIKINFSDYALKLIYPVKYENEINKYAQEFNQSPYLFMSLVREESHFDKYAKSSVGAMGLSQLMSSTANFIEKEKVSKSTLYNEDENIRIGLKYFSYLVDYFNKNEYLAILAYNAGPGSVNKWINTLSQQTNDFDVFVEEIPFLETKNYIKKILSSYWIYLNIYISKNK